MINPTVIITLFVALVLPFLVYSIAALFPKTTKQKILILFLSLYVATLFPLFHYIVSIGDDVTPPYWVLTPLVFALLNWSFPNLIGVLIIILYLIVFYIIIHAIFTYKLKKELNLKFLIVIVIFIIAIGIVYSVGFIFYRNNALANKMLEECNIPQTYESGYYISKEDCILSVARNFGIKYCNKISHNLWKIECIKTVNHEKIYTDPALCKTIENNEIVLPDSINKEKAVERCYIKVNRELPELLKRKWNITTT